MGVLELGTDGSTVPLKQKITVFLEPNDFFYQKKKTIIKVKPIKQELQEKYTNGES